MAPPQLVVSSGTERIRFARDWLPAGPGEVLILSPTRSAADDLARDAARGREGLLGAHRFSTSQLANSLAARALATEGLVPLSPLGLDALVARCVHLLAGRLRYFGPIAALPGFPRAAAATLTELRMNEVSAARLRDGSDRCEDLADLLVELEAQLEAWSLADFPRRIDSACRVLEGDEVPWRDFSLLLLDLTAETEKERRLLRLLIGRSAAVLATAHARDEEAVRDLSRTLGAEALDLTAGEEPTTGLDRLRAYLFRELGAPSGGADETFEFFSAPGEGRECVEIVRRILGCARSGVGFDRMGVLLRQPYLYQPQLEDALRRARIPVHFTRGTRRPNPAGRAFLALLDCAAQGLSAARFAEYLSLAQVPRRPSAAAAAVPWVAPGESAQMSFKTAPSAADPGDAGPSDGRDYSGPSFHWERLLVDASVVGGRERWSRRLSGLERELRLKLKAVREEDPRAALLDGQLTGLVELREFALPLIDRLGSLPREGSWGDWLPALRQLAVDALRDPERVLEVLAELEPMRDIIPVGLEEVRKVLSNRLAFLTDPPDRDRYGKLFVAALDEAAGRSFEVVFLPGLAEGGFPPRILEDPLLLDEFRRGLDLPLRTRGRRLREERVRLLRAVGAAAGRLVASYPRMDPLAGRARVPSLYALELLRAAEGTLPELRELERRASTEPSTRMGWPAPRHPMDAIDPAEYDLARLDRPLHRPSGGGAGEGRFLLLVNPWLARSIRARYKRWGRAWSDVDGIVASRDERIQSALRPHRLAERSYSPTALQTFAACPYRFFLYAVQRLQPREEIASIERMDPLIRGSLVHQTQFELYQALERDGLIPLDAAAIDRLLDRADRVLDAVSARYFEDLAPALPTVWRSEVEELRVDLRCWLREVVAEEGRWQPLRWEFSFGLPLEGGRDAHSLESEAVLESGFRLRGAIDLIERDEGRGWLRITDHKTGKAPWPPPKLVGGGAFLQPLLYGLAAETALEEPVESAQLFYCTQRGDFRRYRFPLNESSRRTAGDVLQLIDSWVGRGFLPVAPRPRACLYCDYRTVCGPYEELRSSRKDPSPLEELQALRQLP